MQIELDVTRGNIPYAGSWMGAWAMYGPSFSALYEQFQRTSIRAHLARVDADVLASSDDYRMVVDDGIAIINISGPMLKTVPSMGDGVSTVILRQLVGKAKRDPNIKGLVLKIDSPGGTVAGTMELAEAIAAFGKPTMAYCSDLCASAAYWVASQCDSIHANTMAQVGSIGTYTVVRDTSAAAEQMGVKVHVISSAKLKGAGVEGTEIGEDLLSEIQGLVNAINEHFVSAVSKGRDLPRERARALADGRVHMAADASKLGLVDAVQSFEDAVAEFEDSLGGSGKRSLKPGMSAELESGKTVQSPELLPVTKPEEENEMAQETVTAALLKERFPNATAEWRLQCLEQGLGINECVLSYADLQAARADAAEQRAREAELKANKPGVDPSVTSGDDETWSNEGGSAKNQWKAELSRAMQECNGNKRRALLVADRRNPGLRTAMLFEHNRQLGRSTQYVK